MYFLIILIVKCINSNILLQGSLYDQIKICEISERGNYINRDTTKAHQKKNKGYVAGTQSKGELHPYTTLQEKMKI